MHIPPSRLHFPHSHLDLKQHGFQCRLELRKLLPQLQPPPLMPRRGRVVFERILQNQTRRVARPAAVKLIMPRRPDIILPIQPSHIALEEGVQLREQLVALHLLADTCRAKLGDPLHDLRT